MVARNEYEYLYQNIGHKDGRPFKILVNCHRGYAFGDMIGMLGVATKVAACFENSVTSFYLSPTINLAMEWLELFPYPKVFFDANRNAGRITLDSINPYNSTNQYTPETIMQPYWQDFVLQPPMLADAFYWGLNDATLRIPEDRVPGLRERLIGLGLDPGRWYAIVHYREPTWAHKNRPNLRDVDPDVYATVVDHIIERQGGQVVRVGHPEMRAWRPRPGFVDLAKVPDSSILQGYAASRARYGLVSPSGGGCLLTAFGVPMAVTDLADFQSAPVPGSLNLTHTVIRPDGTRLRNQALFNSGFMQTRHLKETMAREDGWRIEKSTAVELAAAADAMLPRTLDMAAAWRKPRTYWPAPPNQIAWPPKCQPVQEFFELHLEGVDP